MMPSTDLTRPDRDRRNRNALVGIVISVAILLVAVALVFGADRARPEPDGVAVPAGATPAGVVVGEPSAPVTVDVYLDFQCPACKAYEERVGATLDELVATERAKVVYHPVAFLDRYSSTRYATRASQASACAADAGVFPAYLELLFAAQPPENNPGLPEDRLVALGRQVDAGDGFARCVREERYAGWTRSVTEAASRAGITATPTVLVNGAEVPRTADALRAAVAAAA